MPRSPASRFRNEDTPQNLALDSLRHSPDYSREYLLD
jgi:hypothetical protein